MKYCSLPVVTDTDRHLCCLSHWYFDRLSLSRATMVMQHAAVSGSIRIQILVPRSPKSQRSLRIVLAYRLVVLGLYSISHGFARCKHLFSIILFLMSVATRTTYTKAASLFHWMAAVPMVRAEQYELEWCCHHCL